MADGGHLEKNMAGVIVLPWLFVCVCVCVCLCVCVCGGGGGGGYAWDALSWVTSSLDYISIA